jgi:hypothetical protein
MGVAVTFDDDRTAVEVEPGGEASCPVRIENTGSVVDGVLLDVLGQAAEWASVEPAEVNLLPGASTQVRIVFRPPRSAELAPGEVPFGFRAMSREDPDGSRIEEGSVSVGEFSDLDASLVPKTATGRRSARYRLIVENRGNRAEHLMVEAADADVKLAFRARPAAFIAPAGTATFVRVTAIPRKAFFKGPNRTLPFEISAQPEDGDPVKVDGVMLEKQTLPEWLLPVLGIAVAVAALLIALWFAVLRPVVHSAATAAAAAGRAEGSAKKAAGSAASAASAMQAAASASASKTPSPSPTALNLTLANSTILASTTELASVTGSFRGTAGALPSLVWTTSNPKVATVSQSGVVTGVSAGSATITATSTAKPAAPSPSPSPSSAPVPPVSPAGVTPGTPSPSPSSASTPPSTLAAALSSVVSGSATVNVVGKVAVSTTALTEAAIGKPYSASLTASGGTGSFTWSITKGSLPAGLALTPATGAVTGTPAKLGLSTFTVHVADAGPPAQFATGTVTLQVATPLVVNTSSLPGGMVGSVYTASVAAVGGTPPYTWSLSPGGGDLPAGLKLDRATGAITGTPALGGISNFMVKVTDAASPGQSATESLSVNVVSPLAVSTLTLPTAVLDSSYSQSLSAFGGSQPYTWSVLSGSLPAGLTLSPVSGALSGTPTSTGSSTFTIQVAGGQPNVAASRTFTVSVVKSFDATTSSLPIGEVGQSYSAQLTASGGVAPYVWTLQGTLPAGLSLSPAGLITGTPSTTGIFPFTVQAVDSSSPPLSFTSSLSITVTSPLRITTAAALPEAVTGVAYAQNVQVAGGTAPYTWSVTAGSLPQGLSLSPTTGAITGTAVNTGSSAFTIAVRDSGTPTAFSASLSMSLTVVEPLNFTEPTLVDAVQGDQYAPVTPNHVSGGSGSYRWSITSGVLPAGLSLDQNTGTISGTVTSSTALGAQNFTLTIADAKDASITASEPETITVVGPLRAEAPQLTVVAGQSVSQNLNADISGGLAPYTFAASGLDGLSVDPGTGTISGTPDAPCPELVVNTDTNPATAVCGSTTYSTPLKVTDANGDSVTVELTVTATVAPFVFVPVTSLPDVHLDRGYSAAVTVNGALPTGGYGPAVGGVGGLSFSTSAVSGPTSNNGLPCNLDSCNTGGKLSIDSQTGVISGELTATPALGSDWTFDVTITDTDPQNTGNSISVTFQLSITLS